MTKEELIEELKKIASRGSYDIEVNHAEADDLLLEYINDEEVTKAYSSIEKWYA